MTAFTSVDRSMFANLLTFSSIVRLAPNMLMYSNYSAGKSAGTASLEMDWPWLGSLVQLFNRSAAFLCPTDSL